MYNRLFRAAAAAPLLVATLAGAAVASETDGTDRTVCEDAVFQVYNNCLMSADHFWERALCDVAFELNMFSCPRT